MPSPLHPDASIAASHGGPTASAPREGLAPDVSRAASVVGGRYEFLDAVRGLAALLVAVQHGSEILRLPLGRVGAPLNLGETGVVAFFLVSGFIIPRSLERHGSLLVFWLGRATRLYPAYWLSLLLAVLISFTGRLLLPFHSLPHPTLAVLANVFMLQGFFGLPQALGVYWTLSLELAFYLLCSALWAAGWLRQSARCLWGSIALMLAAVMTAAVAARSLPSGLMGLLVSAFFGTVALRALSQPAARRTLLLAAVPLAMVLSAGLYLRFALYPVAHAVLAPPARVVIVSWVLGYMLFFACFNLRHRQFPSVLLWLGRISYSFYLLHVLVLVAVPALPNAWASLLLDLLLTALAADLSFRLIERPALRLQRRGR